MASLDSGSLKGHVFVVGATGSGKSTLLVYLMKFIHDKMKDASVIFIDPHGDASVQIASLVENPTLYDPIYSPFALNPMDLGTYKGESERTYLVQRRVSELVNMLNELFGVEQSRAPRLLWIFRGLLYYLYSITDTPSFLDLYTLLSDLLRDPNEIRVLMKSSGLDDEIIKNTIEAISSLPAEAFTAVLNRISGFVMPAGSLTSKTFNTRKTSVEWEKMLEPEQVTVFRIPRYSLPDDFRKILTSTIVMDLFFAIEKRKNDGRPITPVYLIIDEFQNVADLDILDTIFSEARKFGLYLVVAHQHLLQVSETLLHSILSNSRLIIAFRLGPEDAEKLAKAMGNLNLKETLTNLPNYTALVKYIDKHYIMKTRDVPQGNPEILKKLSKKVELNEDRIPVYYLTKSKYPAPPFTPLRWTVFSFIYTNGPQVSYERVKNEMFRKYAWDESITLSALNYLQDKGLIRAVRTTEGVFYELTPHGLTYFKPRDVFSKRAGGALHNAMVGEIYRRSIENGYWVEVDDGSTFEEKPDLLVFMPMESTSVERGGLVKNVRSLEEWGIPVAYEIETLSNAPEQIKKSLYKNLSKGYRVVFVVENEENAKRIRDILGEGNYEVIVLSLS